MSYEPRYTVIQYGSTWIIRFGREALGTGTVFARFYTEDAATEYADFKNGLIDVPSPKFVAGDRVRVYGWDQVARVTGLTLPHYDIGFEKYEKNLPSEARENDLELAPPEPRATVIESGSWLKRWHVNCDGVTSAAYTKDLAEHIADGLNAHPEWTL